jgi:hypothetical protein
MTLGKPYQLINAKVVSQDNKDQINNASNMPHAKIRPLLKKLLPYL